MSTDFIGTADQRTVEFCCDTCGATFDSEEELFAAANAAARSEGWRFGKDKETGQWQHFCPECA